jgi:acyl dehydratase
MYHLKPAKGSVYMFDKSKIGQSFPPFTVEVERCKIHELALAIGDNNPIYHSREAAQAAGYKDVPLFPTAPTLFGFWGDPKRGSHLTSVGINVMRILHGEEEYEHLAPIYPGDTLTGVTSIVEGKTRQGKDGSSMDILTTETRYTNQQNQPVLNTRTTIVVRE